MRGTVRQLARDLSQTGYPVTVYQLRTNGFVYYGVIYTPDQVPPVCRYTPSRDRAMSLRGRFLQDQTGQCRELTVGASSPELAHA